MVQIKISFQRDPQADTGVNSTLDNQKSHVAQYRARRRYIFAGILVVLLAGGVCTWTIHSHQSQIVSPLPQNLRQEITFPFYYPRQLPADYSYESNSASLDSDVVLFRLHNSSGQVVTVSEQAEPSTQLGLSSLVGYSPLQNTVGNGVIGTQNNQPSALLETPKTLVTIAGTQDVPTSTISQLAKSLVQVK